MMNKSKIVHIMKDGTEMKSLKGIKIPVPENVLSILMKPEEQKENIG